MVAELTNVLLLTLLLKRSRGHSALKRYVRSCACKDSGLGGRSDWPCNKTSCSACCSGAKKSTYAAFSTGDGVPKITCRTYGRSYGSPCWAKTSRNKLNFSFFKIDRSIPRSYLVEMLRVATMMEIVTALIKNPI